MYTYAVFNEETGAVTQTFSSLDPSFDCEGRPRLPDNYINVTDRVDPGARNELIGQIYNKATDTFSWPVPVARLTGPASITLGDPLTLRYETEHAERGSIRSGGAGMVHLCDPVKKGSLTIKPTKTSTYTLFATGRGGDTVTTEHRVTVKRPS